jgi:hypothetical protein
MTDARQNPDAIRHDNPKDQAGEDKGAIKGPQVTDDKFPGRSDTARASEPATRGQSGNRA